VRPIGLPGSQLPPAAKNSTLAARKGDPRRQTTDVAGLGIRRDFFFDCVFVLFYAGIFVLCPPFWNDVSLQLNPNFAVGWVRGRSANV